MIRRATFIALGAGLLAGSLAIGCGGDIDDVVLTGCADLQVGEALQLEASAGADTQVTWMLLGYPGEDGDGHLMPRADGRAAQLTATAPGRMIVKVYSEQDGLMTHDECVVKVEPEPDITL